MAGIVASTCELQKDIVAWTKSHVHTRKHSGDITVYPVAMCTYHKSALVTLPFMWQDLEGLSLSDFTKPLKLITFFFFFFHYKGQSNSSFSGLWGNHSVSKSTCKPQTCVCFNFLMNGIVRASIHIYNYKQASVHKTDEVGRSRQDWLRQSLQTNPTWTQPVKKSARVKRVNMFSFLVLFTCY